LRDVRPLPRRAVLVCRNYEALGYRYPGGFALYLAVPAPLVNDGSVNRIPAGTPPWTACLAEPLACALNAQEAMGTRKGDTVLIAGGGPMGSLHLLLSRHRGASFIAVSEPDATRRRMAKRLGADMVVNPTSPAWASELVSGTGGRGYSAAIFAVSSIAPIRQLFGYFKAGVYPLLTPGARVNFFAGLDPGDPPLALDVRALHYQAISIFGSANSTPRQAPPKKLTAFDAVPPALLRSRPPGRSGSGMERRAGGEPADARLGDDRLRRHRRREERAGIPREAGWVQFFDGEGSSKLTGVAGSRPLTLPHNPQPLRLSSPLVDIFPGAPAPRLPCASSALPLGLRAANAGPAHLSP